MKVKNPSKILCPPACFPSRQSCLYIISPRWIICSKSTASTCPWEIVQNSPSHSTQNLKSNNRFSKWDYLSASQSQGTNESTMCHQESFWKKQRNPPGDCLFFFLSSHPLPSPKLAFILYFLQKPSSSFCFRFQGVIFTRNFMKSMQTYHVGEGEGEGWFRSQSLIELCILGIWIRKSRLSGNVESFLNTMFIWYAEFM